MKKKVFYLFLVGVFCASIVYFTGFYKVIFVYGNNVSPIVSEINNCILAIKNFKKQHGYLPGDIAKSNELNLNVFGDQDGILECKTDETNTNDFLKFNGEIKELWIHLYQNKNYLSKKRIFPYIPILHSGIVVFSKNNKHYMSISVIGINKDDEIVTENNLTSYQAYLIDEELDDGMPLSGKIIATSGTKINLSTDFDKPTFDCIVGNEYLTYTTSRHKKVCQLIIELDI